MKLYTYWRSTTSYRVRIALALKSLPFETVPVNLVAGDQCSDDYSAINPSQGVPTLETPNGVLTQSMAILDYLDAIAAPKLVPVDPMQAAQIRAAANVIACDIHPVNNLKVIGKLKTMDHNQDEAVDWMRHWMTKGFEAFEALIPGGTFCFGNQITLADVCLVPQLYNAHRWGVDLVPFARLTEIETRCLDHPAFDAARPENQPDATDP